MCALAIVVLAILFSPPRTLSHLPLKFGKVPLNSEGFKCALDFMDAFFVRDLDRYNANANERTTSGLPPPACATLREAQKKRWPKPKTKSRLRTLMSRLSLGLSVCPHRGRAKNKKKGERGCLLVFLFFQIRLSFPFNEETLSKCIVYKEECGCV